MPKNNTSNNQLLKDRLVTCLTSAPGIYQMLDGQGKVLYVGKAKNLKRRVLSYFRPNTENPKTRAFMTQVQDVQVVITQSENEALLLEINLIKKCRPPYNVVFRDDKSYPYLYLSGQHSFPQLCYYRGSKHLKGRYFGPYPSARAVHETLALLQKLFGIRSCRDSFFRNRSRPCLQYQIKRCLAPCVGYVSEADYQTAVRHVVLFLEGKSHEIIHEFALNMESASKQQNYELAAHWRDKISVLRQIQARQYVSHSKASDVDAIAMTLQDQKACLVVLCIRAGQLIGTQKHIIPVKLGMDCQDVFSDFLPQYYLSVSRQQAMPKQVLVNIKLADKHWIANAISEKTGCRLRITDNLRGQSREWVSMALRNAKYALRAQLADQSAFYDKLLKLQSVLGLASMPEWIECFDVSHTFGQLTVASCVVFSVAGPEKAHYRRFNLSGITPGDDYGALRKAMSRHYRRLKSQGLQLPDLIMIDGGQGQLRVAEEVLEDMQVTGVFVIGVAKGPQRKPGLEVIYKGGSHKSIHLPSDSPALHLIQCVRDSAHDFAIRGHRRRRLNAQNRSPLESISGVGEVKRRRLLCHFGGLQALRHASISALTEVKGIHRTLAERIYATLQSEDF